MAQVIGYEKIRFEQNHENGHDAGWSHAYTMKLPVHFHVKPTQHEHSSPLGPSPVRQDNTLFFHWRVIEAPRGSL